MKKIATSIAIISLVILNLTLVYLSTRPKEYIQNGKIIEKRMDGTESLILTWDGNLWVSVDDFSKDTLVTIFFNDNGTDFIEDDIITKVVKR